ncbi:hypothetical protein LCGC14_0787710 [marine sediment metagenome]|uniref:Uncharacterized protein n=1 Tax=marine sediment metagenome TaxID=412755 RepID=A0A0F9QDC5_9ZZZZ
MKIISYMKMPKKYFDICEARRCPKEAKHLVIIQSKNRDEENVADEYSFCDKHLNQFKDETANIFQP